MVKENPPLTGFSLEIIQSSGRDYNNAVSDANCEISICGSRRLSAACIKQRCRSLINRPAARAQRTGDVGSQIVAHVQDLLGRHAQPLDGGWYMSGTVWRARPARSAARTGNSRPGHTVPDRRCRW